MRTVTVASTALVWSLFIPLDGELLGFRDCAFVVEFVAGRKQRGTVYTCWLSNNTQIPPDNR